MIPPLTGIDHLHVSVPDRAAAEPWYRAVLGLHPVARFASWADGGPLMLQNEDRSITLAVFERSPAPTHSVIAFGTDAAGFLAWNEHLEKASVPVRRTDHDLAWSLYFDDPFGNGFEVTTYEHDEVSAALEA